MAGLQKGLVVYRGLCRKVNKAHWFHHTLYSHLGHIARFSKDAIHSITFVIRCLSQYHRNFMSPLLKPPLSEKHSFYYVWGCYQFNAIKAGEVCLHPVGTRSVLLSAYEYFSRVLFLVIREVSAVNNFILLSHVETWKVSVADVHWLVFCEHYCALFSLGLQKDPLRHSFAHTCMNIQDL